jgi:SPP1 gp7 family putative phage head morphogenesis protein
MKYIKEVCDVLKDTIVNEIDIDNYLSRELESLSNIYKNLGNIKNLKIPTVEDIKNKILFTPYQKNKIFDTWLESINNQFLEIWDSAIRTGYLSGMTTPQIIKNVLGEIAKNSNVEIHGSIESFVKSLKANTRTALQSFATQTRNELYKKNKDIFSYYRWMSTLDKRSCLVCGSLDGKIEKKITNFEQPPLHLNCRCIILAEVKGYEDFYGTRASDEGYVDGKITYNDWLQTKTEKEQKNILGNIRYNIYKEKGDIDYFVKNNSVIPLDKLN